MTKPDKIVGRGSRWEAVRKKALRLNPFCAFCGTTRKLQVHHLMPYRLKFDNRQANLLPVCRRHHHLIEAMTRQLDAATPGLPYEVALRARRGTVSEIQDATRMALIGLLG